VALRPFDLDLAVIHTLVQRIKFQIRSSRSHPRCAGFQFIA